MISWSLIVAGALSLSKCVFANTGGCTTVAPVFEPIYSGTSTRYRSTKGTTTTVDCSGCSLATSTFSAIIVIGSPTKTVEAPVFTSTCFICEKSTATASTFTHTTLSVALPTPTASPLPKLDPTIQTLIDELSTAFIYATLISNTYLEPELCSVLQPSQLSAIKLPNINGTAVQGEVCAAADLSIFNPVLSSAVSKENIAGVSILATALFAVQLVGGYADGKNLSYLCDEIDATALNGLFANYTNKKTGDQIKELVCKAAGRT